MDKQAMHKNFADWYRDVSIEPSSDLLELRWQGVTKFADNADADDVVDLTRVFVGLSPVRANFADSLRLPFKEADAAFPMKDNDAELTILAGACLVQLTSVGDLWDVAAALAVLCAAAMGQRTPVIPEIVSYMEGHMTSMSLRRRPPNRPSPLSDGTLTKAFQDAAPHLKSDQLPAAAPHLEVLLGAIVKHVEKLTSWSSTMSKQIALWNEESDILWWVYGGHSRELEIRFQEVDEARSVLQFPKELSDLTLSLPGPPACRAYLDTVLGFGREHRKAKLTVSDIVSACPLEWQSAFTSQPGTDLLVGLCPIHTALRKSNDAGGDTSWHKLYANQTGLSAKKGVGALDLAVQVYNERLLARTLAELRKE